MAACHPARFKAELLCEDLLFGSLDPLSPLLADTDVRSFFGFNCHSLRRHVFASFNVKKPKKSDLMMLEDQLRLLSLHLPQSLLGC